ncbi:hypothetical protein G6F65_020240 [Rhizopus arrhizus]|nr:hypothetical protein G6F65_020240 [Rhizopus arrhizus]
MTGIKRMRSSATSEAALIYIEFSDWDRDIAIAASDARERIDAIRSDLPDDLQRYNVFKWSSSDQPVLKVRLASTTDLTTAYDMLDREFKRRIEHRHRSEPAQRARAEHQRAERAPAHAELLDLGRADRRQRPTRARAAGGRDHRSAGDA